MSLESQVASNAVDRRGRRPRAEYIKKITAAYPSITGAEAKICALIKAGLSNKEIASLLVTSPRTVDTHRSNIRRKMRLGKTENLERTLRSV